MKSWDTTTAQNIHHIEHDIGHGVHNCIDDALRIDTTFLLFFLLPGMPTFSGNQMTTTFTMRNYTSSDIL